MYVCVCACVCKLLVRKLYSDLFKISYLPFAFSVPTRGPSLPDYAALATAYHIPTSAVASSLLHHFPGVQSAPMAAHPFFAPKPVDHPFLLSAGWYFFHLRLFFPSDVSSHRALPISFAVSARHACRYHGACRRDMRQLPLENMSLILPLDDVPSHY